MLPSRNTLLVILLAACAYYGWTELSRTSYETVVMRIPPTVRSQDTYVRLWVVEDGQGLWVRAESPSRLWLPYLKDSPVVEFERLGRKRRYETVVDDTARARAYVDPLFREKYGLAEAARAPFRERTVPIRLTRS